MCVTWESRVCQWDRGKQTDGYIERERQTDRQDRQNAVCVVYVFVWLVSLNQATRGLCYGEDILCKSRIASNIIQNPSSSRRPLRILSPRWSYRLYSSLWYKARHNNVLCIAYGISAAWGGAKWQRLVCQGFRDQWPSLTRGQGHEACRWDNCSQRGCQNG